MIEFKDRKQAVVSQHGLTFQWPDLGHNFMSEIKESLFTIKLLLKFN